MDLTDSDQEGPTPDGSRDGTVEATGADDNDLPTLEELILQAKARRIGCALSKSKAHGLERRGLSCLQLAARQSR